MTLKILKKGWQDNILKKGWQDIEAEPSDDDLKEAIRLKCANCYGALSMANTLAGSPTPAWQLCHAYELKDIVMEAQRRGIDISQLKSAVANEPVQETMYYKRWMGLITEEEFQKLFQEWKNNDRPWCYRLD